MKYFSDVPSGPRWGHRPLGDDYGISLAHWVMAPDRLVDRGVSGGGGPLVYYQQKRRSNLFSWAPDL